MIAERRFVPWSLPLAVGMVLGIVSAASPGWFVSLPSVGAGLWLAGRRLAGRRGLALITLVGLFAGGARYLVWAHRPDPVAALLGSEREFSGRSDGRLLRLEQAGGAPVSIVPRGSVPAGLVRVRGVLERSSASRNPGGFDFGAYLERRGVAGRLFVDEVLAVDARMPWRERFRLGVRAGLPGPRAALLEAMTLGVRDELGDVRDAFAAAGLAHLLSVSGMHLGILIAALARLAGRLGPRRYPLLMLATVAYVVLVGPLPSVLRASSMVLAVLLCLAWGYPRIDPWPALALAACVGLAIAPAHLFDASFQLSYLALAGILLFTEPIVRPLLEAGREAAGSWKPRSFAVAGLAASVAAQLPTLSLVAGNFGAVPLLSPVVNLAAAPLVALLLPLGFLASLLGLVWLPLAALFNQLLSPVAGLLLTTARLGARLPQLPWGHISALGHVCFAAAIAAVALVLHGRLRPWRGCLVVLVAIAVSGVVPPLHGAPEVVFLDVGQGDASLVRLPRGVEVLIDGGGSPFSDRDVGDAVVLPALRALGVGRLDVVVATHPDLDHVEGLLSVLREVRVGTLVVGIAAPERAIDVALRELASQRGVAVHEARRGERWVFGRGARQAVFEVVNPPETPYGNANDNSVAFVLRYGGAPQVLFVGDLAAPVERVLAVPHVPVLKVAHHGSAHSTSAALLRATRPRLAIVSVGANGYGHPSPDVLARLAEGGATVLTTRRHGAVRVPLSARGPGPATVAVP